MNAEMLHASMRGAIAAAAMTGMRTLTGSLGLVDRPPPEAIAELGGLLRHVPVRWRRAGIELAHWAYGAQGGAMFRMLPQPVRERSWAGPVYGLALWAGFELGLAPLLGLRRSPDNPHVERAALMVDHVLYGFVLSEMRRRPQR